MKRIKTKSFELAVYAKGNEQSDRIALVLPGRLDTKDYVHMRSHVEYLAKRGFYALSFDPPGSWESPGNIKNYTTTTYLKAVNELIERLGNRSTLLLGHSRGGTISILAGATNSHVVGIVPIMATYGAPSSPRAEDLKAGVHITYRDLPPGSSRTGELREFRLPLQYFADGEKYNPTEEIKKFEDPKLLVFGTHDKYTKPERVQEVYKTLVGPKMILELDTDHDYRYHPEMIEAVNKAIGQFIDKFGVGDTP